MRHSKVLAIEDFQNQELFPVIQEVLDVDVGPHDASFPMIAKAWESAMTVRALRQFGGLRPDAEILGIGAGMEPCVFFLTNFVKRVFATDLYASNDTWQEADSNMLVAPDRCAPVGRPCDLQRLVVQHMDARCLQYPDATFDGIFSNGSIEHFGGLAEIAQAVQEMARVLKPGGVVTLATEYRVHGPEGELGLPGTVLFTKEMLETAVLDASELCPLEPLDDAVSAATAALAYPFSEAVSEGIRNPSVCLTHQGFTWTSVFVTMTK